jgi:hypothetical protein
VWLIEVVSESTVDLGILASRQPPTTLARTARNCEGREVSTREDDTTTTTSLTLHPPRAIKMAQQALSGLYKAALPLAIGASIIQSSIYDVKGGTRAVIFDRYSGVKDTVVNEGTHFLIPWLQKSIIYDVRTKPRNISTTTGSKDLQMVSLTLRVLHRPEVPQLPKIYQV